MIKSWARYGPGLMLAASAVGVSHLVQSTRVGSDYGLSLAFAIVMIAALKYPAFRFAVDYANATGKSLVDAYRGFGAVARAWLALGFFVDMFIATAAVSLVTAGLVISVFGLQQKGVTVALGLVLLCALLLGRGHYARAEWVTKVLVLVFTVLVITATVLALPRLGSNGRGVFAPVHLDQALLLLLVATMGWMPLPMTGSIFLSAWAVEKRRIDGDRFDRPAALRDLRFGWNLTVVIALCFVVLGAAVLYGTQRVVPASTGQFATELLGIFSTVIGKASYPVIAVAAITVMGSTLLALMDALPRVTGRLIGIDRFGALLLVQVAGVAVVLLFLLDEFATFINFATGTGFLSAPALAWYNYRAVTADDIPEAVRPGRAYVAWHWLAFTVLSVCAVAFLAQQFRLWPFAG